MSGHWVLQKYCYAGASIIAKQEKVDHAVCIYALSIHDLGQFYQTLATFPVGNLIPKRKWT